MSLRTTRIKFIWGSSKVIRARWRFGLWGYYERMDGLPDSGLAFSVRGLLTVGLLLTLLAYVGGATGIYLWLDRRGNNYVTYTDVLLLPVRWDDVQAKRGQAYIDEGIANLKTQNWAAGEMKLRLGLARYPQALNARQALSEFYFYTQRSTLALKVLEDGMQAVSHYPGRRYLSNYFTIAQQADNYEVVIAACDRYLQDTAIEARPKEKDWLVQQKLGALLKEGRAAEALTILEQAPDNAIYNEQRVLVLLELQRPAEANRYLEQWRQEAGVTAQILRLQVRTYRELAQNEKMDAALNELKAMQPSDPRTLAYAVIQKSLAGQATEADAALENYFFRFGGFAANYLLIAQPLAEIGEVPMLQKCLQRVTEQGYDQRPFLLLLAQAQLKQGVWSEAKQTTTKLNAMSSLGRKPEELAMEELAGLLAEVAVNPAEGPQVQLLKHLEGKFYAFRAYRSIAEILTHAGRHEVALEVIARAEKRFPTNQSLGEMKTQSEKILADRRADRTTVEVRSPTPLFVEDAFFSRMDGLIAEGNWSEASSMIRDVNQARPTWLKSRESDVLSRQMRVAQGAHEVLGMTLAARLLLDGSLARSQIVVDFAQELYNRGDAADAIVLVREVVRKMPTHATARRLFEEWSGKPDAPVEPAEAAPAK